MENSAAAPAEIRMLPVASLAPNPWNRTVFDPVALEELTVSIRNGGIEEPLIVRATSGAGGGRREPGEGKLDENGNPSTSAVLPPPAPRTPHPASAATFEIASGQRRWMAAKKAGLTEVPCIVRDLSDAKVAEMNIEINLQRESLPPLEMARMVSEYLEKFKKTHQEAADQFGKSRVWVTNLLGFLAMDPQAKGYVSALTLSWHHLTAIKSLPAEAQRQIAKELKDGVTPVAKVERRCNQLRFGKAKPPSAGRKVSQYFKEEGYNFVREGDSIIMTAKLPWGPTLDVDGEMAKLRGALLLWIAQEGAGSSQLSAGSLRQKESKARTSMPQADSRQLTAASPAKEANKGIDDMSDEELAKHGITRAPSWPPPGFKMS